MIDWAGIVRAAQAGYRGGHADGFIEGYTKGREHGKVEAMTALYERPSKHGKALITMHLEATSPACPCPKLASCGGVHLDAINWDCPEHGRDSGPEGRFHTHAAQVRKTSAGIHHG